MKHIHNQISTLSRYLPLDSIETKGRKQYICPYAECQKVFKESGNLKTHIRIHVLYAKRLDRRAPI